jgi:hypothetical protein
MYRSVGFVALKIVFVGSGSNFGLAFFVRLMAYKKEWHRHYWSELTLK